MTAAFRDNVGLHEDLVESIPQGRGCNPKEVSQAILFLASDEASYITGHGKLIHIKITVFSCSQDSLLFLSLAMVVDGGYTAHSGFPNFLKWMPPAVSTFLPPSHHSSRH
jgi:NAD(P)-dependent dehydrogenase (short-subunit alcohol dehydrogenase family)